MGVVERARELRRTIEALAKNMDDAAAVENPEILPAWEEGRDYQVGDRINAGGRVLKATAPFEQQEDPDNPLIVFEEVND